MNKMYRISDNVAWVREDDQYLLANYNTGKVCIVSGTGIDILNCITEGVNFHEMITMLKNKYNQTDRQVIEKEVKNFVQDMMEKEYLANEG